MKKTAIVAILLIAFTVQAQESKLIGTWQLSHVVYEGKTETGLKAVFIFAEKGVLKAARSTTSKSIDVGSWKYNKRKKTIVMTSELDKDFNGAAKILKLNDSILEYNKDEAILSFKKITPESIAANKNKITQQKPVLLFEQENMLDEQGDFNYEQEEQKLPWKIETIVNYLKSYNEIVYDVTHFADEEALDSWVESEKINYNEEEQSIDVRRFSYFQNDYIDMTEDPLWMNNLPENEYDFMFFPKENLNLYKVVGTENVGTPIGVFECTVVEGYGDFDGKIKYWMVNDKPGVFAKIIRVNDARVPFFYTNVYTLKEIK
ncbi:MAG: hypothetical protein QM478_00185 [Flavobacteriaceae bacterium]